MRKTGDSTNHGFFSYRNDSILKFHSDSIHAFDFGNNDFMYEFEKQLNDSAFIHFPNADFFFDNDSIWEKHKKLLEKYMQDH